uniref:Uncharacterized protein n=1 Tax=Rhizophora mucronata TaxID=61149 RepID=A0A2P2NL78_RHIMU
MNNSTMIDGQSSPIKNICQYLAYFKRVNQNLNNPIQRKRKREQDKNFQCTTGSLTG